jgi:hypothetical protein
VANQFYFVLNAVRIWILLSTLLVGSGWILSAFHELNRTGYGIVFALAAIAMILWQRKNQWRPQKTPAQLWRKFLKRFKHAAPLLFLTLVLLSLAAGALYAPSNGSSTQYRIPRVMHWLAAGHWYWLHMYDSRNNIAGCNFEWLFGPVILWTHTDRFLFLFNWLAFLLLPGLVYSVFTRLGVRPRVAWWWMWLLPSGWCFIVQAGSTVNDAFGTAYALAAVDFALRARENRRAGDAWLALLAAALVTGVKQTNLPLALPGLIVLWPVARVLLRRPLVSLAVAALAMLVSALPMIVMDWLHTGNWAGVTANSWGKIELQSPFWGIVGNIFCLSAQNLKPPVFPFVNTWDAAMKHFLQTSLGAHFNGFESFGHLTFGTGEDSTALGAGISLLLLISLFAARRCRRTANAAGAARNPDWTLRLLRWTPWLLLLVFMAKDGAYGNGRHLAPYYIFLFPSLLLSPGQSAVVRRRWWQILALLVMVVGVMVVVVSRDRPLFPSQTIIGWLQAKHPDSHFISHVALTYSEVPDFERNRVLLRQILPAGERVLGYCVLGYSGKDGLLESSVWLPFGQRRVRDILPGDDLDQPPLSEIHYVVIEKNVSLKTQDTLPLWLARHNGVVVTQWTFVANPYEPPHKFYLVHLERP